MGSLIVVSGLSGSGKSTIMNNVIMDMPHVHRLITVTTRERRPDEVNGVHYIFVSREKFKRWVKEGRFIEWAMVYGNLYGSLTSTLRESRTKYKVVAMVVDVQGAKAIKTLFPEAMNIFIRTGAKTAEERIKQRGSSVAELDQRTVGAKQELKAAQSFDYHVDNNGKLSKAVKEICEIIKRHST